jgi:hypothetical protein
VGSAGDAVISYPAPLKAVGGARTGIAPANLLDVLDVNGNLYFWSDRKINAPNVLTGFVAPSISGFELTPPVTPTAGQQVGWAFPTVVSLTGLATGTTAGGGSGSVSQEDQGPFTTKNQVGFSNYEPATLPPGAIIDDTYLVINHSAVSSELVASAGLSVGPAGQSYISISGVTGEDSTFQFWNTVPPTLGSPGYISAFLGSDPQEFTIYSIGIAVYYHFAGVGGGGTGGSIFNAGSPAGFGPYLPWILSVPQITFHRSLQTDFGNFVLQNLSGNTVSRDFQKIMRSSALEGALFVYRLWQPDAMASWLEVHGTLTVDDVGVDTVSLKGVQLINPAQDDTPLEQYCETCQLQWGGKRCGSQQATECQYSFQTCQVVERIMVALNDYEKNYGETTANTAFRVINRARKI